MRVEELAMRHYFGAFGAFVAAVALTFATAQTPAAQQKTAPAGAPPKKNPLLKLAEPWPEADVLKQRRKEAEAGHRLRGVEGIRAVHAARVPDLPDLSHDDAFVVSGATRPRHLCGRGIVEEEQSPLRSLHRARKRRRAAQRRPGCRPAAHL